MKNIIEKTLLISFFFCLGSPIRLNIGINFFDSVSILDIFIFTICFPYILTAIFLNDVSIKGKKILVALTVPMLISIVSVLWTEDLIQTLRNIIIYFECIISFIFIYMLSSRLLVTSKFIGILLIFLFFPILMMWAGFNLFLPYNVEAGSADYVSYFLRLSHPLIGRSNALAGILAPFFILFFYKYQDKKKIKDLVVVILLLLSLFLTLSRGVILATLVSIFIYMIFLKEKILKNSLILIIILSFFGYGIFNLYMTLEVSDVYILDRLNLGNISSRFEYLSSAIQALENKPLLGYGGGVLPDDENLIYGVHNSFLEFMINYGVFLGMICCISIIYIWHNLNYLNNLVISFGKSNLYLKSATTYSFALILILLSQAQYEGSILRIFIYVTFAFFLGRYYGDNHAKKG